MFGTTFGTTVLRIVSRVGIACALFASFLLAACASSSTSTTVQRKPTEPLFDIYTTGTQNSNWSVDNVRIDNANLPDHYRCTTHVVGHGRDFIDFAMTRRTTVRATVVHGDVILTNRFGVPSSVSGEAFGGSDIRGLRDTTGTMFTSTNISPPGTCQPVAGGSGGGTPPPPVQYDCGVHPFQGPVALQYNKRKISIQGASLTPVINDLPAGFVPCPTAEYTIIDGPPAIEGEAPANLLLDNHTLSFQVKGHGSQVPHLGLDGYSGQTTLDWTMTFCRVNSTLTFQEAKDAALLELGKSGFFTNTLQPYLTKKQVTIEETPVIGGDTAGGSLGRPFAAAGNRGPFKAEIRWDNITDVYLLASVLAHELGHADLNIRSGNFNLNEAAPFLTKDQFRVLGFEGEYEADMAALHVLQNLRAKATPEDARCIQTQIDGDLVMKTMDAGHDDEARKMIMDQHDPGYLKNYDGAHNLDPQTLQELQDIQPLVTKFLQSPLWQQIQANW